MSDNASDDARDRVFQYDAIGSRQKTAAGTLTLPGSANYVANALNQYTTIPNAPSAPVHDADGSMTSGPLPVAPSANATLLWDAENRLVKVTRANNDVIAYDYDYLSRRIRKTVTPSGGSATTTHYLYDGWNVIAEFTGTTLERTYTWGMDLSGSMQGAGGVGGLLSVSTANAQSSFDEFYPTYDGNGNVSEYLAADGSEAAHYEYDAFGNTVVNTDSTGKFNYRFSTKPLDSETGLYYYGYRYYDPITGRWPSRDPIEEEGGVNLYGFVGNLGPNGVDILGLDVLINAQQSPDGYYVGMHANKGTSDLSFWVSSTLDDDFSDPADPYEDTNADPNGGPAGEGFDEVDQPSWWPWSPNDATEADQAADPDGGEIISIHISGKHKGNDFSVDIEAEPGTYVLNVVGSEGCVPPLIIDNSIHTRRTRLVPSAVLDYYTGGKGFD